MTAALAAPSVQAFAEDAPRGFIQDSYCDPSVYMTVGRMLDFCNQRPMSQPFTARGIVIDTTADIAGQLREFFPSHIDLSPVIDRIADVCLERARATAQPLQVVSFDHLKQIKPIESDDGNMDTFIEVLADRRVKISQFMGHKTALKAGAGGGAGGDPSQMLAELRQADIQGFGLQIKSLDISDAKATELLSKMGIAQAFGGDGMAIGGALETIAKGGPEAKAMQVVVEQVAEIKTLKAALHNAPDTATAQPIATAIALKTEALSAQLPIIQASSPQTTAAIKANVAQTIDSVKVTVTALQMEAVTTKLAAVLPAGIVKVAAGLRHDTSSVQIARAVAAVDAVARTNAMPVRDVVALVMTNNATPAMTKAVETLAAVMTKPDFFPTIERGLPASVAAPVRQILTTPSLQQASAAPIQVASVAKAVTTLAEKSNVPTIKAAAEVVMNIGGQRAAVESVAPALHVPQLQAVVDNLQALAMTKAVPPAMKTELATVTAQVQALVVQMRSPEPAPTIPAAAQPLPPQAPLAAVAQAVNILPPASLPAPQPAVAEFKGAPNHWGETPNAPSERLNTRIPTPANDTASAAPVLRFAEPTPAQPVLTAPRGETAPVVTPVVTGVQPTQPAPLPNRNEFQPMPLPTHQPSPVLHTPVTPVQPGPVLNPTHQPSPVLHTPVTPVQPGPVLHTPVAPVQPGPTQPREPVERMVAPREPVREKPTEHRREQPEAPRTAPRREDTARAPDNSEPQRKVIILKQEDPKAKGAAEPKKEEKKKGGGPCPDCSGAFCGACAKMGAGANAGQAAQDAGVKATILGHYERPRNPGPG